MTTRVYAFSVTVPAGTVQAAPLTQSLSFDPAVVSQVEVVVPPGPLGNVGWFIGAAGQQVIPREQGSWIVTDDEVVKWPVSGLHDSGSWQITAYNTGSHDHTLSVRFLTVPVADAGQNSGATGPLPPDAISNPGSIGTGGDTTPLPPPDQSILSIISAGG